MNDALKWIEDLISAHENLSSFNNTNESYRCYSVISKEIPMVGLKELADEAGLSTLEVPFGEPGEYPDYKCKLICKVNGWELYELISEDEE